MPPLAGSADRLRVRGAQPRDVEQVLRQRVAAGHAEDADRVRRHAPVRGPLAVGHPARLDDAALEQTDEALQPGGAQARQRCAPTSPRNTSGSASTRTTRAGGSSPSSSVTA